MKTRINQIGKWLLFCALLACTNFAIAQRTVSGVVLDGETSEPLIGASVIAVGTSSGTITDFDGKYSITVPPEVTALEFSYTGFASKVMELTTSDVMDLSLSSGTILDEVVVVGYGTSTQKELTSAVTSIKAEDFNQGNVNDPIQLIQGKVAGLSISNVGNDPNGTTTLRLRGLSTFSANTEPLVVIDGIIGATLNTVDPNDIASIDVLKDGSAAAIYGSRASAGVIIITTKRGVSGKTSIEYNASAAVESVANTWDVADGPEYLRLREKSIRAASPDATDADVNELLGAINKGENTDWIDEVTNSAFSHIHNLSLSGGNGGTTYRASFNFRDIEGVGIKSGFEQINGRLNLTQKAINDRLTVGLNFSATQRDSEFGFNEAFRYATIYNPTAPVNITDENDPLFDKFGGYFQAENFDYFNPVAIAEQSTNEGKKTDYQVAVKGTYELMDGLSTSMSYSRITENFLVGKYYPSAAYFRGFNETGLAEKFTENVSNELYEWTGQYERDLGGIGFKALVGYSWNEIAKENNNAFGRNFISDDLGYNALNFGIKSSLGDPEAVKSSKEDYRVIGFFGRVNFDIDDTYFISASLRQEGSSRLGPDNKWGLFPAVSAGVNLGNILNVGAIDNLKLRVGYGETGALPKSSYGSILRYQGAGSFFFNGNYIPSYRPEFNQNSALKWETKGEFDVGLDFAMMDYKLTGTIDFYNRRTRDLLYDIVVPVPPNFADKTNANLDDVVLQSTGIELSIGYLVKPSSGAFTWEPRFNFATYNTKLNTIEATDAEFAFFQTEDNIFIDPTTTPGAPGLNNSGVIALIGDDLIGQIYGPEITGLDGEGKWLYANDGEPVVIGNGLPDYSIGFQNNFTFGNFNLGFFLRGDMGHDLVNMNRVFYESLGNTRNIDNFIITDKFDENLTAPNEFNSHFVEDASFLMLDNLSIGYSLPLADGGTFEKVRVTVTGRNLFWLTNYSGIDPSVRYADAGSSDNGGDGANQFDPNPLAPGLDRRNNYFTTRSFVLGLNVGF